ncbi:MAG: DUF222 domain-containing protein [Nocardioidaceae bacterium]
MTSTGTQTQTTLAGVVDGARAQVAELAEELWAAKRPEALLEMVRSLEALRSTLDAVELSVIDEIEATDAAKTEQWGSTRDFVTATAGGRKGCGPQAVRLARALASELGATRQGLLDGWLSREQARVIARVVDLLPVKATLRETGEELMLEQARSLDASDLDDFGRGLLEILDPEGCEKRDEQALARMERAAHHGRFLSIIDDHLGGVRIKGRGSVEDAATIRAALLSLTKPDPACGAGHGASGEDGSDCCGATGRDPREYSTRLWDAWVEASQRLLDANVLPECHGAKPRISITISYADLVDGVGTATLETGQSLSVDAVRRLACHAELIPIVLGSHGEVLDVGRTIRLVTLAIWKALVARDRHCRFPGCKRPPIACDAHHIKEWLEGGETSLDNLVLLCRAHHTAIHQTPWVVRLNPIDRKPEFIPPDSVDPLRRPTRSRCPRGTPPPT